MFSIFNKGLNKGLQIGKNLLSATVTQTKKLSGYGRQDLYLDGQTSAELLKRMFTPDYRYTNENAKFLRESLLDLPENVSLDTVSQETIVKITVENPMTKNLTNFYPLMVTSKESVKGVLVCGPVSIDATPVENDVQTMDSLDIILGKIGMLDPEIREKFPKIIIPLVEKEGNKLGHGVTLVLEAETNVEQTEVADEFMDTQVTYDTTSYKGRVLDSRTDIKKIATTLGITHDFDGLIRTAMTDVANEGFMIDMSPRKYLGIQPEGTDDSSCGYYSLFVTKELITNPDKSIIKGSDWVSSDSRIPYQHLSAKKQEAIRRNIRNFCANTSSEGKSMEKPLTVRIMDIRSELLSLIDIAYPNDEKTIEMLNLKKLVLAENISNALKKDAETYGESVNLPVQSLINYVSGKEDSYPSISKFFDLSFMPTLGNKENTRQQSTIDFANMILEEKNVPSAILTFRAIIESLSNAAQLSHKISTLENIPENEDPITSMKKSMLEYMGEAKSNLDDLKKDLKDSFTPEDFDSSELILEDIEESITRINEDNTSKSPGLRQSSMRP